MKKLLPVAAALAVLVLALAGYRAYDASQERAEQRQVAEALRETTLALRQSLAPHASRELVARIEASLQAAKAPRDPELQSAAELYIVGAREIAERRIEIERLEGEAAADAAALEAHMTRGGRRNDAWFARALELKKRVEREHADLDRKLQALEELLHDLPKAQKRLAPRVEAAVLLGDAEREAARRAVAKELERAGASLQRVRALAVR